MGRRETSNRGQRGQGLVEFALVIALVAAAATTLLVALATRVTAVYAALPPVS